MRFPILGRSVGLKKKILKKNQEKSQNKRPCYPRTTIKVNIPLFGLTKYTIYCKKKNVPVFVPVFLYSVTTLIFQIKRIISSEK